MNLSDSTEGRWLSPDPMGGDVSNPQSLNRYAYALNNPETLTDPLGTNPSDCTANANGGVTCTGPDTVTVNGGTPPQVPILIGPCSYEATEFAACYGGSSPAPPGWVPFPSSGGGGGSAPPPKPAPPAKPPLAPPNANLCTNIAKGAGVGVGASVGFSIGGVPSPLSGAFGSVAANVWLADAFQTGGQFDYKTQYGNSYANFGNFNFGAVCQSIGDSQTFCQSGAGLALMGRVALRTAAGKHPVYNGQGVPFFSPPYGDQPGDSAMIAAGYEYAEQQGCH
jgi:Bacterial toxin 44